MDKKLLATFKVAAHYSLTAEQLNQGRQLINKHYLGDVECNMVDPTSKRFVSKYPDKETEAFTSAHHLFNMSQPAQVTVGLYSDGSLEAL